MYQDKSDLREEEDKQLLGISDDIAEDLEDEQQQSSNPEFADREPTIEEIEDKETGLEEVMESDKVSQ